MRANEQMSDRAGDVTAGADPRAAGRAARRDAAVRAAVEQGFLDTDAPLVGLLDVTSIRESAADLRDAFEAVTAPGTPVLHAFAVKASPLVPVLRLLREEGIGAEVASPGELALARAAGVEPGRTVLDSPPRRSPSCGRRWSWASPSTRTTRRSWSGSTRWWPARRCARRWASG